MIKEPPIYCSNCGNPTNRSRAFSQCLSCVNDAAERIASSEGKDHFEATVKKAVGSSEISSVNYDAITLKIEDEIKKHPSNSPLSVAAYIVDRVLPHLRSLEPVSVEARAASIERDVGIMQGEPNSLLIEIAKAVLDAAGVAYVA